jgi:uncharacterized protein YegL
MKKGMTEIVLVVDKSGSMGGTTSDTIGGLNTFISTQKDLPGSAKFTLVFFNDRPEKKYFRVDLSSVNALSNRDYTPNGNTALIDAVCSVIDEIGKELANIQESERPEKVIVGILTDGQENSSHEFTLSQLSEKIKTQTDKYQWEFLFMGANIDAFAAGQSYNVKSANTMGYATSNLLATRGFSDLNATYTSMRTN